MRVSILVTGPVLSHECAACSRAALGPGPKGASSKFVGQSGLRRDSECMPANPERTGCWKQAKELTRALDIESVLCLTDRTPLGRVEEVRSQNPDSVEDSDCRICSVTLLLSSTVLRTRTQALHRTALHGSRVTSAQPCSVLQAKLGRKGLHTLCRQEWTME